MPWHTIPMPKQPKAPKRQPRDTFRTMCVVIGTLYIGIGATARALPNDAAVGDIGLDSVEIVDLKDRADAVWLSREPRPSRQMVMVNLSTRTNLSAYARRYEYDVGNVASICSKGSIDATKMLQGDPYVYDDSGKVDAFRKQAKAGTDDRSPIRTYHLYFNVKPIALAGRKDIFVYDLQRQPEGVCVQLLGGNMVGDKFFSKVVTIPKEVLGSAISHATFR
jgi:hypothetical protein